MKGRFTWRLEFWLPSFGIGDVRVARLHQGRRPALVRVEQSTADGRALEERVDGKKFDGETIITMRSPNLDPPCPISWDWEEPESERRPAITFPEAQIGWELEAQCAKLATLRRDSGVRFPMWY